MTLGKTINTLQSPDSHISKLRYRDASWPTINLCHDVNPKKLKETFLTIILGLSIIFMVKMNLKISLEQIKTFRLIADYK